MKTTAGEGSGRFRGHSAEQLLGIVAAVLEGELLRADDDLDGAITVFEAGVEIEDGLRYDEPEPLPFAARHWLGAALLEAGQYADAETAYRDELKDHPHNGWSLFGLKAALAAQGKTDDTVTEDFDASWARSDVWITASRF